MSDVHTYRPRASSVADSNNSLRQPRVDSPNRHTRTSSEFSISRSPNMGSRSPVRTRQQPSLQNIAGDNMRKHAVTSSSQKSFGSDIPYKPLGEDGISGIGYSKGGSFLDLDESESESTNLLFNDIPIIQRNGDPATEKQYGTTLDELVDRLLAQPMSKQDNNFIETFLCLYRKFAAPSALLELVLKRLEIAGGDMSDNFLIRTHKQLRIVGVLTKWIMTYPGDFACPVTRDRLVEFVERISTEPAFSYPALEIKIALRTTVVEDDDTMWEQVDADCASTAGGTEATTTVATPTSSLRSAPASKAASKSSLIDESRSPRHSGAISELSTISVEPSLIASGRPSGIQTVQEYEIEAASLLPTKRKEITKPRWQQVLEIPEEDWACEITRMDWVLFSSVRVRDLLRDVNSSNSQKTKFKSLVNVTRAINHFNHVAAWVTNMILFREKPKHRALMLEKFMRIAWKLRQLNNYNGLAAVMAGLQNTAVSRLAQTQALISADDRKTFMRLEILMGPRRSHFAYRLAWQNSPLPRIPYIPLSRRDLSSAEEGSKTFIDGRINWKKMEVFGAVILPIIASTGSTYQVQTHAVVRQLILDTAVIMDDEALYQRSVALEASSNPNDRSLKSRFKMW